jgi:dTDP-4-dehydrorhamnose reductase
VAAPSRSELDLSSEESVRALAGDFEWIVNCAAYTAVDKAEVEQDAAHAINALGPERLGRAASRLGARILHVSTDFVFDGRAQSPYTEEQPTHALGAYGRSKLEGEERLLQVNADSVVARTAWLYGPNGGSFPRTMIRAWLAGKTLRVVADQVGSPTYTADLARVMVDLIEKGAPAGVFHTAGPEPRTWHAFAIEAIEAYRRSKGIERSVEVEPIRTEDWPTPAARPAYSVLDFGKSSRLGIAPMRPVAEALAEFVVRLPEPP